MSQEDALVECDPESGKKDAEALLACVSRQQKRIDSQPKEERTEFYY